MDGLSFTNSRISSLGTTAATTAIKLASATNRVTILTNFGNWAVLNDTAAMLAGGFETIRTGDLKQGLMAGLGAYGGAGLAEGVMGAGANALTTKALGDYSGTLAEQGLTAGTPEYGEAASKLALNAQQEALAKPFMERASAGFNAATASPEAATGFAKDNWKSLAAAATPILADQAVKANMPVTTTSPGQIRNFTYNPYGQSYASAGNYDVPVRTAADGGMMNSGTGGAMDSGTGGYSPGMLDFTQQSEPVVRMADGGTPPPPSSVADLYTSILGRAPDAGGLAYWQQQFGNTIDPSEVNAFTQSANVELANRTPAEQQQLAPNLVGAAPTGGGAPAIPGAPAPTGGISNLAVANNPAEVANQATAGGINALTSGAGTTTGAISAADAQAEVANMYRNVLGRDPDPDGLKYWTDRITSGSTPASVYSDFLGSARGNTEMVTADQIKNKDFAAATTPYTGYQSSDQSNIVDEWVRNTLGREPTAADKAQTWYKDAFNAMQTVPEAQNLYGQFQDYAKADVANTTAQKIKDATASLAARGLTDADVMKQTGKTIAQLAASDVDFSKNLVGASQLLAPGTKAGFDFGSIKNRVNSVIPDGYYGNNSSDPLTRTPGDITKNTDGTVTVQPNIPGRPYGGFSGMGEVKDAYTAGGGSLGYTPYAPKTAAEHDAMYNTMTGGSKQAYDYLSGKAPYSATPYTPTGEVMKPYSEATLGMPADTTTKQYVFDPKTKQYTKNLDYVPVSYNSQGAKVYGTSSRDIISQLPNMAAGDYAKWMTDNNVTLPQIAQAMGISLAEATKRYGTKAAEMPAVASNDTSAAANGGLMALAGGGRTNTMGQSLTKDLQNSYSKLDAQGLANSGQGKQLKQELDYRDRMQSYQQAPQVGAGMANGGAAGQYNLGSYSDGGRLLRGPGDGVSDSIPATIGQNRPARLADGEFVVPARIVSELGNGSTEAGARQLYSMMDRIQKGRKSSMGKGNVANNSRADKHLPA